MAVEAGAGLALASPPNNVLGWPKGLLSEQMESPTNETLPISPEPVGAPDRGRACASLAGCDHVAGGGAGLSPDRGLLQPADADAPSGRPTQRARTRPPFLPPP